jgi:hypothetical protein
MQNMGLIWAQTHPPHLNFASPLAKFKRENNKHTPKEVFPKIKKVSKRFNFWKFNNLVENQ